MTSTIIYTPITPTYLYIKQHFITKKKYFGKTTEKDPIKYKGSGVYWKKHIKKHGNQFVETIWVSDLYFDTSIREPALHFSCENNIDESNDWANLIPEDGLNGGSTTKGMASVVDSSGNYSLVPTDDPRLKSGELVGVNKGNITVVDQQGNTFSTKKDDPRYLSGEYVSVNKGRFHTVEQKKKNSDFHSVSYKITDPKGIVYYIKGITTFCKSQNLPIKCFCSVVLGRKPDYKGWTCVYF